MRFSAFLLFTLFSLSASAATVYSWVDENGVTHFTDAPPSNKKHTSMHFAEPTVVTSEEAQALSPQITAKLPSAEKDPQAPEIKAASAVSITSPQQEATVRDNQGIIIVSVETNQPLSDQQHLLLLIDGQAVGSPQKKPLWQLNNVDRGEHQLKVQLLNNGKVIASSKSITVFLHRAIAKKAS